MYSFFFDGIPEYSKILEQKEEELKHIMIH